MTATVDEFMTDAVSRGLSKLMAISQASGYLRGTPLTVRDLGSAYDKAKTAKEDPR